MVHQSDGVDSIHLNSTGTTKSIGTREKNPRVELTVSQLATMVEYMQRGVIRRPMPHSPQRSGFFVNLPPVCLITLSPCRLCPVQTLRA